MIQNKTASLLSGLALAFPLAASAQMFSDDFSADSSANYSINASPDSSATFGWDYNSAGIPSAPNTTDSSTLGLRTITNRSVGANDAITLIPSFTAAGDFTMTFDIWMNYVGSLDGGGTGSTEFAMAGFGIISGPANFFGNGTPRDGTWFGAAGDGYDRVFRTYADDILQGDSIYPAGSRYGTDAYYTAALAPGGVTAPAAQTGPGSPQTDATGAGALGFAWRQVEIVRTGTTATFSIDGLLIATVENAPTSADTVFIGHWDQHSGVADSDYQYNVIDNLNVIPEPGTYAAIFGGLALVGACVVRRRKNRA